jgi:hypothetical protein
LVSILKEAPCAGSVVSDHDGPLMTTKRAKIAASSSSLENATEQVRKRAIAGAKCLQNPLHRFDFGRSLSK